MVTIELNIIYVCHNTDKISTIELNIIYLITNETLNLLFEVVKKWMDEVCYSIQWCQATLRSKFSKLF